jgi:hypothetical protein
MPPPAVWPPGSPDKASYYDNTPLRATLERLVDFDPINAGEMRFSVGAVEVGSGNFTYFDTTTRKIGFEHIAASGSLPPGLPSDQDRRRVFLGRRLDLEYAAGMGAQFPAAPRHARFPGRPLECPR